MELHVAEQDWGNPCFANNDPCALSSLALCEAAREKMKSAQLHPAVEMAAILSNGNKFSSLTPQKCLMRLYACLANGVNPTGAPLVEGEWRRNEPQPVLTWCKQGVPRRLSVLCSTLQMDVCWSCC
jgi:hypothetical protein